MKPRPARTSKGDLGLSMTSRHARPGEDGGEGGLREGGEVAPSPSWSGPMVARLITLSHPSRRPGHQPRKIPASRSRCRMEL
jgi:hypothetical protein